MEVDCISVPSEPADKDGAPDCGSISAVLPVNNPHMIGAIYEIYTQPAYVVYLMKYNENTYCVVVQTNVPGRLRTGQVHNVGILSPAAKLSSRLHELLICSCFLSETWHDCMYNKGILHFKFRKRFKTCIQWNAYPSKLKKCINQEVKVAFNAKMPQGFSMTWNKKLLCGTL